MKIIFKINLWYQKLGENFKNIRKISWLYFRETKKFPDILKLGIPIVSLVTFPIVRTTSPISPPSRKQPSLNQWTKRKRRLLWKTYASAEPSCPGKARSRFKENKYGLKKPRDFTVSEGHRYPLVIMIMTDHYSCWFKVFLA